MPSFAEKLRILNLPVFDDIDELASLIHISSSRLEILAYKADRFYKRYTIPKKNGGVREIFQPSSELKAIQAWILRNILDKLTPSNEATAFIRGRNLLDNVSPHVDNRFYLCVDIENFFPSISFPSIYNIFGLIGYPDQASTLLSSLCLCGYFLPQGGVTSPSLSNLVASKLDRRLSGYASKRNIVYTRYADDMTFSSNNRTILNKSIRIILEIIESERFTPNLAKLRVMGPKMHCSVTGLVKDSSRPKFGIGKRKKRKMRAIMYNMKVKNIIYSKYKNEASIEGWLNYLKSVDKESYSQMSSYWHNLRERN